MTTNQQGAPEALTLAGTVDHWARGDYGLRGDEMRKAAAEIRRLHAENERLAALVEAQQPSPTPQADSQPAPQGETNAHLDTDSNSSAPGQQRDVAGTVALGQSVGHGSDSTAGDPSAQGDKLLTVAERNIRSFLRSATFKSESDREAALNCVDVLWEAARAPADSVTAPAGGVDDDVDAIALARYKVAPAHESMFHRFAVVAGDGKQQLYLGREMECANMARKFAGAFLDGAFYQANIAPTPPAQAADSVMEDAERYRFLKGHCRSTSEHWGGRWSIVVEGPAPESHDSEDDFDKAVDAARKQTMAIPTFPTNHLSPDRSRRIYISGPMTGLPDLNFPAFHKAEAELVSEGWTVLNPASLGLVPGADWHDYLRWDIAMLATCEAIFLLPGWSQSKGVALELHIAKKLEMQILYHAHAELVQEVIPNHARGPVNLPLKPLPQPKDSK